MKRKWKIATAVVGALILMNSNTQQITDKLTGLFGVKKK